MADDTTVNELYLLLENQSTWETLATQETFVYWGAYGSKAMHVPSFLNEWFRDGKCVSLDAIRTMLTLPMFSDPALLYNLMFRLRDCSAE